MNKMRILHITKKYPNVLGGDAEVVFNLEKQQRMQNHEVFIITSNCLTTHTKKNVLKVGIEDTSSNLDRISLKRFLSLLFLLFFGFKNLKRINPHIIHSHSADMGFVISLLAKLYKIPVVHTCHGVLFPYGEFSFVKRSLEKFCLKYGRFERIITVDKRSIKFFKKEGIKNVIYIPNGVDVERFNRKTIKGDGKKINFLFVGRLEEQKGIKYLFEACSILKETNEDFKILIVGDGSQKKYLEALSKKLNLTDRIVFLGKMEGKNLVRIYHESNAFVLPSLWEGLPLTLLEAWASGLPPIVTSVGGILDVCVDKENALIIPPRDPKSLANAMLTLIKNKKLREKLGKNGKEIVKKKYSWRKISEKIEEIYKLSIRGEL